MLTVSYFLVGGAFLVTMISALGKAPLWVAVLLLTIFELLQLLPR